jgi:UDP-N-acetyl-D-mannosaminuronic acid transferase (WecB/TagA/CpsF family)/UDP-N-acetylmuramyl pentapeptide phosphotransferase/UDP-N-acetylglucosamine-1-phosphate transferase
MLESGIMSKAIGITISSILMIVLGRVDRKKGLSVGVKLIFQVLISLIIIYSGIKIEFLRDPSSSGGYIYLKYLSIPLTIIWLVSITNSISQTDELTGITPYIIFIASLTFLAVSLTQRQGLILAEILSLIMATVSFIYIKYLPRGNFSSYYMSFGFILAVIAIAGVSKSTAALTLLIPILILGVPLIDSSYSIIANYIRQEDEENFSSFSESKLRQKLQSYGFSPRGANLSIISISLYLSLSAIIISVYQSFYLLLILTAFGWITFEFLKNKVQAEELIIERDFSVGRIKLFQVGIDQINNQEAVQRIEEFVISKKPHLVVTPDTLAILRARKDPEYQAILKSADLVTPDGAGILWATITLNCPLVERVTGIDIIYNVCRLTAKKGYSLYLLGASPGIAKKAAENLIKEYPGIKIVGTHHGYFNSLDSEGAIINDKSNGSKIDDLKVKDIKIGNKIDNKEEKEIIREIEEKRPDILLVGMGVPKQEKWITKNLSRLNVPVCMGVGGSFDVLSGKIPRAPLWMQKHGMEWIYRLIREPKKVFRIITLFYFIWLVILGKMIFTLTEKEID